MSGRTRVGPATHLAMEEAQHATLRHSDRYELATARIKLGRHEEARLAALVPAVEVEEECEL